MPSEPQQNQGHLHLCFRQVAALSPEAERALVDRLGASEVARLESINNPGRRVEYLTSRRLMREALARLFGPAAQAWRFEERRGQPPLIAELPRGHHINLSHSKGLVCFAIADGALGVDIEIRERQRDYQRLARMFMTESERDQLSASPDPSAFFYRCWCLKEAFYKAQPKSRQESLHFSGFAIADLERDEGWSLTEGRIGEHYLAAATRHRTNVTDCHYYPEAGSWQQPFIPARG